MGRTSAHADGRARYPRAVVVPFAVPDEGRNLGLGLAALVHSFVRVFGQNVALAQLLSRDDERSEPRPVEALVSPKAWGDISGSPRGDVSCVLTGQLEPPSDGRGLLRVVAFEPASGKVLCDEEASLTPDDAGSEIVRLFKDMAPPLEGELGLLHEIEGLAWDALESVLLAERGVLHDPARRGPHDGLAALLHLGRAVAEAPEADYPAGRLAAVGLDLVLSKPDDEKLAAAVDRALARAVADAPEHAVLHEARGALELRRGGVEAAEAHVRAALEREPRRPRLHVLLAEARRGSGDFSGAMDLLDRALLELPGDPLLETERAVTVLESGDLPRAAELLGEVLTAHPGFPPAYMALFACGARLADADIVERLAFDAANDPDLPSEVTRRVLRLFASTQPESAESARFVRKGAPRPARERAECMVSLAERLVAEGSDAWAELTLARGKMALDDLDAARAHLARVETLAPASALAAEACRTRFALDEPGVARELEHVVRTAQAPSADTDLAQLTARARTLAGHHDVWPAHFALGATERRRERWAEAREALEAAVRQSPGATPAHLELVAVHVALGSAEKALEHADRACALEGETARTLAVRATALLAASKHADARATIDRALALDASEANRAIEERIRKSSEPPSAFARLRMALGLGKKR